MNSVNQEFVAFIRDRFDQSGTIALHEPKFQGNEKKYLLDTIESTFVSSSGAYIDRFEKLFPRLTGTKCAVAVVNGTAALQIALSLVGVKEGEEVLTQALTFVATCNSIHYNRCQPIFVDVDLDTMGMSPQALDSFLQEFGELREEGCYNKASGKRIAACVPMHTFGFMCRIDEIVRICEAWQIPIVEDAAEALGSYFKAKPAGSFGVTSAFSFNGNKIVTAGGGGAIVSNIPGLGELGKHLTTTAKVKHAWNYVHDQLGYNYRMPNLNAALLCAQLEDFESRLKSKQKTYAAYDDFFNSSDVLLKPIPEDTDWNYWLMSVQLENFKERNDFLRFTNENKVLTRPIWQLMFRLPMYAHCQKDEQLNAIFLEERIVNIPSNLNLPIDE